MEMSWSSRKSCSSSDDPEAEPVVQHLRCPIVDMPITYLSIPLMLQPPTSSQLKPVVDKTARKLPTWKAQLRNKAGRLAFVKSAERDPYTPTAGARALEEGTKAAREDLEGISRAGHAEANGDNCHVN